MDNGGNTEKIWSGNGAENRGGGVDFAESGGSAWNGDGSVERKTELTGADRRAEFEDVQFEGDKQREGGRRRDPGLENALGIVSVGATGVDEGERAVDEIEVKATLADNRTSEEVAMEVPEVAKDGDKMEEAWILRAKQVVEETRTNPSERLKKTARLREEYLLRRFNRILGERN